jgi:hypothetical protein
MEILCETYHQALAAASALEMSQKRAAELTKTLGKSNARGFRLLKIFAMIVRSREGLKTKDLSGALRQHVSGRTMQADLARLRELQLVQTKPIDKGKWGKPNSRKTTAGGRPPVLYVMNPQLRWRDYIINDDVAPSDRKFFSLAEKLLLSMPGFKSANERLMDALLDVLPQLSNFMNAAQKSRELRDVLLQIGYDKPPPGLDRISFMIGEEIAANARSELRLPIDGETLSMEERRRLEMLDA